MSGITHRGKSGRTQTTQKQNSIENLNDSPTQMLKEEPSLFNLILIWSIIYPVLLDPFPCLEAGVTEAWQTIKEQYKNTTKCLIKVIGILIIVASFPIFLLLSSVLIRVSSFNVHGLWCGPGRGWYYTDPNQLPAIDELDETCRIHDACYDIHGLISCECDADLMEKLEVTYFNASSPFYVKNMVNKRKAATVALMRTVFNHAPCTGCKRAESQVCGMTYSASNPYESIQWCEKEVPYLGTAGSCKEPYRWYHHKWAFYTTWIDYALMSFL